jgi:hypothetical protein
VSGSRVIDAYEASDEVNAAAFRDGWFRTGDVARRDADGWLYLSGRVKEIINRGGEKIAPLEIDAILLRHPDVVEAAAFGIPDAALGEEIAAAVVLRRGAALTEDELRSWLTERLAFHKCPRQVRFVPTLPKGPTGKLLRSALSVAPVEAAPSNALIAMVCDVWAKVLQLPHVVPDARFLDIGGSSAAALIILVQLSERIGNPLSIEVLLDGDTPAALAAAIARRSKAQT